MNSNQPIISHAQVCLLHQYILFVSRTYIQEQNPEIPFYYIKAKKERKRKRIYIYLYKRSKWLTFLRRTKREKERNSVKELPASLHMHQVFLLLPILYLVASLSL